LITEHGFHFALVCRLRHVDRQSVSKLLGENLILGTGYHLDSGNVPRDRDLLVTDVALEDGVLAFDDFDVFERLRKLELFVSQPQYQFVIKSVRARTADAQLNPRLSWPGTATVMTFERSVTD